jgi:hypothetical protein
MSQVVATGVWPVRLSAVPSQEEDGPQGRGYSNSGLADTVSCSADNPIALFQRWFREVIDSGIEEPSAMTLATVDVGGDRQTSARSRPRFGRNTASAVLVRISSRAGAD